MIRMIRVVGQAVAAWVMVAAAAAPAATPRETVQAAVALVITALEDTESGTRVGRARTLEQRPEIQRMARRLFDFEEVARRTLARHWAERSAAEQAEFVKLYTDLLERTYVRKIKVYAGEEILFVGERVADTYATVNSRIISLRRTQTTLDYQLHLKEGRWKVYDVLIDGVSFVASYRTQFDRIITNSSYASLINRLRRRVSAEEASSVSPPEERPRAR